MVAEVELHSLLSKIGDLSEMLDMLILMSGDDEEFHS